MGAIPQIRLSRISQLQKARPPPKWSRGRHSR